MKLLSSGLVGKWYLASDGVFSSSILWGVYNDYSLPSPLAALGSSLRPVWSNSTQYVSPQPPNLTTTTKSHHHHQISPQPPNLTTTTTSHTHHHISAPPLTLGQASLASDSLTDMFSQNLGRYGHYVPSEARPSGRHNKIG